MDDKLRISEAKGQSLTAQKELLTGEVDNASFEVNDLQEPLKNIEEESAGLNEQLMGNQEEELDEDDELHPMEVFPEEIWRKIFGLLTDSRDLKSCYETSPVFQPLLAEERSVVLFENVIKIVTSPMSNLGLYVQMELTSFLKECRLVCQTWKESVDALFQKDCSVNYQVLQKIFSRPCLIFSFEKNPWNDARLISLNSDINPIPSRFLVYREKCTAENPNLERERLHPSLQAFLTKYGHHVWYFQAIYSPAESYASWYSLLLTWLNLMPNLKALFIQRPMGKWWTTDPGIQMQILKDAVLENPHALKMTSLKAIVFENCPPVVIEATLISNPQIERLAIERDSLNQVILDLNQYQLKELQEVWVTLPNVNGLMDGLEAVNWTKLKKLHLQAPFVNWTLLFETLEKRFGSTLEELELSLQSPPSSDNLRLGLPNLKVLKLTLQRHFQSIDFILPLDKLEELSVDLTHMYQYQYEKQSPVGSVRSIGNGYKPISDIVETIKIHQYTHNLKDSNIWKLFPKLKTVKARTDRKYGCDVSTPKVEFKWQTCSRG